MLKLQKKVLKLQNCYFATPKMGFFVKNECKRTKKDARLGGKCAIQP